MIPPGRDVVVIAGFAVLLLMTILSALVAFPALLDALTVKLNVPAVVGVPVIAPVFPFKFKPAGRLPADIDQVIGAVPVAESV